MSDPQLMKFFNFNESELNANRNGRLSERQKARLQNKETGTKIGFFILGAFHFFIALLGPTLAAYFLASAEMSGLTIGLAILLGLVWLLIWGALGLMFGSRAFVKKMEVTVKKVEGPVSIMKIMRSGSNSDGTPYNYIVHELRVNKRTFEVGSQLENIMTQGGAYAVYYAVINAIGNKDPILSVELLANVDAIYSSQPPLYNDPEVVEHLKKGDKLRAIKAHRAIHNSSLAEAKSIVEEIKAKLGH